MTEKGSSETEENMEYDNISQPPSPSNLYSTLTDTSFSREDSAQSMSRMTSSHTRSSNLTKSVSEKKEIISTIESSPESKTSIGDIRKQKNVIPLSKRQKNSKSDKFSPSISSLSEGSNKKSSLTSRQHPIHRKLRHRNKSTQ